MALTSFTPLLAAVQAAPVELSGADTSWMLISTALVLLMTPALGFFYGGLVRSKNMLNTLMMSFASLGVVGMAWFLLGYSLAFAPGNAWIGGLDYVFLKGVGLQSAPLAPTIPHMIKRPCPAAKVCARWYASGSCIAAFDRPLPARHGRLLRTGQSQ